MSLVTFVVLFLFSMLPSYLTPVIVCRPALPLDTPAVMDLTREIWGGEDYVPQVWSEWLADHDGLLAVAEYAGKVAGLGKLTRMGFDEWWLEGLRTHPELQGLGIASHIHDYILDYWQLRCQGVIRLVTNSQRIPVQHLCERTGFTRINEFALFTSKTLASQVISEQTGAFRALALQEIEAALAVARQSPAMEWTGGLVELGWQWASPSASRLVDAVQPGLAWWWESSGESHNGLLVLRDEEESCAYIELLACNPDQVLAMLSGARWLAQSIGYAQICWMAPLHPHLLPILASSSFLRDWEDSLYLYERRYIGE